MRATSNFKSLRLWKRRELKRKLFFGGFTGSLVVGLETLGNRSTILLCVCTCRLGESRRRHLADELSHASLYISTQMAVACASGMLMDDCLPCLAYFPTCDPFSRASPLTIIPGSFLLLSSSCISLLFSFRLISTFDAGPLSNSLEW